MEILIYYNYVKSKLRDAKIVQIHLSISIIQWYITPVISKAHMEGMEVEKVWEERDDGYTGSYVLGSRKERSDWLTKFGRTSNFVISNKLFKLLKLRLHTFKYAADK